MASLQVRELPAILYGELKRAAEREHRSLSQQAIVVLKRGLRMEENPKERRARILDELRRAPSTSEGDRLSDPAALVRKDRER